MRFFVYGNDLDSIEREMRVFRDMCNEETKKHKVVVIASKILPKLRLPELIFVYSVVRHVDKVELYVASSYLQKAKGRMLDKMVRNLEGFLNKKGVAYEKIETQET